MEGSNTRMAAEPILVINSGSSSLKIGVYADENGHIRQILDGLADGIGTPSGKFELKDSAGRALRSETIGFASTAAAFDHAAEALSAEVQVRPHAIGHRVVHGGPKLVHHQQITPQVIAELKACVHFAPLHIPASLALIDAAGKRFPSVPQFACFDTAFHTTMPETATRFPLPDALFQEGVRRYGFHGLSYESIVHQLGAELPPRTIVAHLGNGASLAAIRDGKSIDTSMGLTPTGGIPMATRTGDLDPGVILYLQRVKKMNADELEQLLNKESGLKALSGGTSDMRSLQDAAAKGDTRAAMSIDIFCAAIAKYVAAYATELGGLDLLVFAGGIGEHSAQVRSKVCERLRFMRVSLDATQNARNAPVISSPESAVSVRIVPAQEDIQIARHCASLLAAERSK